MAELCRQRNDTVMASYAFGKMSLDFFAEVQAQKVKHNRQIGSLRDSNDFEEAAEALTCKLLGEEDAAGIRDVLKEKVIGTADHHGSLYCSQFLQGNILLALILEKLGNRNNYVPVLAAGQVELENSTYSRGISAYFSRDNKQFLPLFPAKFSVQLASHADPVSPEMIDRFRKRFVAEGEDLSLRQVLQEICRDVYGEEDLKKAESFSDQTTVLGKKLVSHLFQRKLLRLCIWKWSRSYFLSY